MGALSPCLPSQAGRPAGSSRAVRTTRARLAIAAGVMPLHMHSQIICVYKCLCQLHSCPPSCLGFQAFLGGSTGPAAQPMPMHLCAGGAAAPGESRGAGFGTGATGQPAAPSSAPHGFGEPPVHPADSTRPHAPSTCSIISAQSWAALGQRRGSVQEQGTSLQRAAAVLLAWVSARYALHGTQHTQYWVVRMCGEATCICAGLWHSRQQSACSTREHPWHPG